MRTLAAELEGKAGRKTEVFACDLEDSLGVAAVADRFAESEIDVLVNNAGYGANGEFLRIAYEKQAGILRLNIEALTELTWLFAPGMRKRGHGHILNVASTAAFQAGPYMAVYCASKAYVLSFSEALHEELRGTGVSVTALCPGATKTEFDVRADMAATKLFQGPGVMTAAEVARVGYEAMRAGKPLAIAGLVNRLTAWSTRLLPRQAVAGIAAKILKSN